jgi:lipoprotein-anchoring transpeptidase ErfK/SrfK
MQLDRTFGVAVGQSVYPTPLGRFSIAVKWRDPWWYPPNSPWAKGQKPIPPGPGNPLGTRWMGITSPGVGIHGTPDDASIGYSLSHGCVRMHIPDAEWLFDHVNVGTPVYIVDA